MSSRNYQVRDLAIIFTTQSWSICLHCAPWGGARREDEPALDALQLGERLRAVREQAGIGVRELSRRVGLSASMISQLERGLTMPSVTTLYAITTALDVSLDAVMAPHRRRRRGRGVRRGGCLPRERRRRHADALAPGGRSPPVARADGRPPDRAGGRRALGAAGGDARRRTSSSCASPTSPAAPPRPADALQRHEGREYGTVVEGRLGVTVGFTTYELEAGDSISFASTMPHRLFNLLDDRATTGFWVVVGRAGEAADERGVYL